MSSVPAKKLSSHDSREGVDANNWAESYLTDDQQMKLLFCQLLNTHPH